VGLEHEEAGEAAEPVDVGETFHCEIPYFESNGFGSESFYLGWKIV